MTQKRDPIVSVLDYFETAELPLARQALTLAQQIIRRRTPKAVSKPATVKKATPPKAPIVASVGG